MKYRNAVSIIAGCAAYIAGAGLFVVNVLSGHNVAAEVVGTGLQFGGAMVAAMAGARAVLNRLERRVLSPGAGLWTH